MGVDAWGTALRPRDERLRLQAGSWDAGVHYGLDMQSKHRGDSKVLRQSLPEIPPLPIRSHDSSKDWSFAVTLEILTSRSVANVPERCSGPQCMSANNAPGPCVCNLRGLLKVFYAGLFSTALPPFRASIPLAFHLACQIPLSKTAPNYRNCRVVMPLPLKILGLLIWPCFIPG